MLFLHVWLTKVENSLETLHNAGLVNPGKTMDLNGIKKWAFLCLSLKYRVRQLQAAAPLIPLVFLSGQLCLSVLEQSSDWQKLPGASDGRAAGRLCQQICSTYSPLLRRWKVKTSQPVRFPEHKLRLMLQRRNTWHLPALHSSFKFSEHTNRKVTSLVHKCFSFDFRGINYTHEEGWLCYWYIHCAELSLAPTTSIYTVRQYPHCYNRILALNRLREHTLLLDWKYTLFYFTHVTSLKIGTRDDWYFQRSIGL